jgi:formylglycine-generating enzyme required for sulfatase activity
MAQMTTTSGASYCIDTTEVTVGHYAAFLASSPPLTLAPAGVCSWKTSFVPDGTWPLTDRDTYPVSLVDYCDASAYCAYAGKHLCGKVGGGANAYPDFGSLVSEWFYTCSSGGVNTYPYGRVFDALVCVGIDYDHVPGFQPSSDMPHPVGTAAQCHPPDAPLSAVLDLDGNVAEWEDSCSSTNGSADYCHVRGDSYREGNATTMGCAYAPRVTRSFRSAFLGFRCCMEP